MRGPVFFVGPFVHFFCFLGQPSMLGEFSLSRYKEAVIANKPGTLVVMLADNKISKLQEVFRQFIESTLKKGPTIKPIFAELTFKQGEASAGEFGE